MNNPKNLKAYKNGTQYSKMNSLPKIIQSPSSINLKIKNQSVYNSSSSFNNTGQQSIRTGEELSKKSDFFTRNYDNYLEKIRQRNKINSRLKSELELNSLLYKLKNFYSEVIAINKKKNDNLIFLKKTLDFEEFKLNQVIEFQDIELPDEKISVKNVNELKFSKTEVEKQLRSMMKEKQHLDEVINNATEYFRTIEYMCEEEKNRFKEIKAETNVVEEKIHNVSQYQRIVNYNIGKGKIKEQEEKILEDKLNKGLEIVDEVNVEQKIKNEQLDKIIFEKEKKVEELKNKLLEIKRLMKLENIEYQNEIKKEIEKGKEFSQNQKIKEKKILEIIYCLYLIQNYFFNEEDFEDFDRKKVMQSNEYKLLQNRNFEILLNKKKIVPERSYSNKDTNTYLPLSPTLTEKNLENKKLKLESDTYKKTDEKQSESQNDSEEEENEQEEDIKKTEEKKENPKHIPSIFLTNLQKKLSLRNIPINLINLTKESKESKEKSKEKKHMNTFRDKKPDIFSYMKKIEDKNKKIKNLKKTFEKEKNKNNKEIKTDLKNNNISQSNQSININNNKEDKINSQSNSNINIIVNNVNNVNNNSFSSKKLSEIEIPTLEELKEKFALIEINRKTLFNYNSKLTSKLNFYKTQFDAFHKKELELEDKHSLFYQKTVQAISKNYLAFKLLVKLKPELKLFLSKNKKLIEELKKQDLKNKLKEMNKSISKMNPINNIEKAQVYNNETNNENTKYEIDIQFSENMDLLISSSKNIIIEIKDFFMKCNDYLKQMKASMELILNSENPEENDEAIQEYLKLIIEEINILDELIQKMNKKKIKNEINFVNYIKNLINYSKTHTELKQLFDEKELNKDLLNNFYQNLETKKLNELFYKQFKLKNFPELDAEFNHFTSTSEDTINNIKKLIDIVNALEKSDELNKILTQKARKIKKRVREPTKLYSISTVNNKKNSNDLIKIENLRYPHKNRIFNGFKTISLSTQKDTSYSELEFMTGGKKDEDDIPDNYTKKKVKRIKRKKFNSVEENIVNKLYSPFLQKTSYLRKLNQNMKGIKSMTTLNSQINHTLRKRKGEIDSLTYQMYVYNNPLINSDKLANQTYNSLVGLALRKHKKYKYDKNFLNPKMMY